MNFTPTKVVRSPLEWRKTQEFQRVQLYRENSYDTNWRKGMLPFKIANGAILKEFWKKLRASQESF